MCMCWSTPSRRTVGDAYYPAAIDPVDWIVVFRPWSSNRLVQRFVPGHFKHVSACAYCADLKAWVTFDVGITGTKIMVIPDGPQADAILTPWLSGCTLIRIRKNHATRCAVALFGWCVPSIARLIGVPSGALRPDTLYRHCLRNGGAILAQIGTDTPASSAG